MKTDTSHTGHRQLPGGGALVLSLLVAVWGVLGFSAHLLASPASPSEHQVKAAMVFHMTKFVDWPDESFPAGNSPFTICILGTGQLESAIEALRGKTIRGRQVVVRQISQIDAKEACQILVIGRAERHRLRALLGRLSQSGVLTISDMPRFASAGGIVGFVELDGKVSFEINLEAARQERIRISSHLLKLAHIVKDGE